MPRHPPCALISLTYSRIMSCFSTEELFEIVFYPLNFFNWISLISSLLFRYSIFKEHLSLSDIWSLWVLLVELRRIELLTPCLQGRCSPSWATPPKVIIIHFTESLASRASSFKIEQYRFKNLWASSSYERCSHRSSSSLERRRSSRTFLDSYLVTT